MRQRERTCNSVCNSVREADIIWQKTKEVLTHVTGNFGQLSPDKHNLPSEANTDMSLLMSLSTMAYDWDVHFKRWCQREHLLHTRLLHILLKSTKCLHLWAPAGSNRQGRRGRALDGQQCGGSVSITIPQDAYWSGTNLICSLFFPGLRTPNLLALCCDKNFAKLLPFNFWIFRTETEGTLLQKCAENERCALEQCLLFQNEDCHLIWNADISDKHAYLS